MTKSLNGFSDDFVLRFTPDLYHCSSCNYCVDAVWPERGIDQVCVTMEHHTRALGYSGRGFIETARAVLEGTALDAAGLAERAFTCTSCGNCESVCPIGLRPASIGQALREELVDAGCVPAAIGAAHARMLENDNPYGAARSARMAWSTEFSDTPSAAAPVYFAGCAAALAQPSEARAGFELLRRAGCAPLLATTDCCGAPFREYGARDQSDAQGAACAATLEATGRTIVVSGYECQQQLSAASSVQTVSVVSWLLGALRNGEIELTLNSDRPPPRSVYLLETCQLKRRTQNAPASDETAVRKLFAALGIDCTNPRYPSPYALCCGAGGGMPVMQEAAAMRMAAALLPSAGATVTLDPRCAAHLRTAAGDRAAEVYGIAEFVARYCTLTPIKKGQHDG